MREVAFSSRFVLALLGAVLCSSELAGDGGGSARTITPYGGGNPSLNEVKRARQKAGRERVLLDLEVRGKAGNQYRTRNVAFGYCRDVGLRGDLIYRLAGHDPKGQPTEVELSDLQAIVVEEVGESVVIGAVVFPDITPEQLRKDEPTFEALGQFRTVRKVRVARFAGEGAELCLVEVTGDGPKVAARIGELELGRRFDFEERGRTAWWAIPSVSKDAAYPYRAVFKK